MRNRALKFTSFLLCSIILTVLCSNLKSVQASTIELSDSQIVENELENIIDMYGEDNIIMHNGIIIDINSSKNLNDIIEENSIIWKSNNEEIVSVDNGIINTLGIGTTFIIGIEDEKYHVLEVYVKDESIEPLETLDSSERRFQYVVYLDPGHGGSDPGAIGNGLREKDLTLNYSRKLRDKLQSSGIKVVMSRDSDVYVSLKDRSSSANAIQPDIFISIHMNSINYSSVNGIETFYHKNIDKELSNTVQNELIKNTGAYNRGSKYEDFHVMRETKMPAILVECGFISNPTEASKLKQDWYRDKIVNAISTGAKMYLEKNINIPQLKPVAGVRVFGNDRYETSHNVFNTGWGQAENVILASGTDYPDALCASPLAAKFDAPILLVENKPLSNQPKLIEILKSKGVKNAYIVGGTGVINESMESELQSIGIESKRLGGSNRYETSVVVANEIGNTTGEAVVAYGLGFADSLSISSVAAQMGIPILLTETNEIPVGVSKYISSNSINKVFVVGSTGVVSDRVANSLPNVERLGGRDRYETNLKIFNRFKDNINLNEVFIASGLTFPDALSASALAAKNKSFVVLSHNDSVSEYVRELFVQNNNYFKKAYILGSKSIIKDSVLRQLGISL